MRPDLRSQVVTSRVDRYRHDVPAPIAAPLRLDQKIFLVRGERVMLDADLAEL
jgi:hypothetical protein